MSDLIIKIGANSKELASEYDKIKKQTAELEAGLSKVAKVSGIAFAGLTASAGLAVNAFAKFDNELRGVKTLLDETSFGAKGLEQGFDELKKGVIDLSRQSGQDLSTLNKALFDTVSAGVDASKAVEVLGVSAKLATAGLTDVSVATDGLTSALNAYQLDATLANDVASKFFTAQKFGKTTIEELASGFGLVGANAQAAGVSLEELLGAVSAVTTAGVRTNAAYTGLKAALANISKPTAEAQEEAKRLGIEFNAAALRSKGLEGFLKDLTQAQGFTKDSVTKLFGSVEAQSIAFALTGAQAEGFARNVRELGDAQKAAATFTNAYKTQTEAAQFQVDQFKANISALVVNLGEQLAPIFSRVVGVVNQFIDVLNNNDVLISFAASVLKIGIAVTGIVATLATGALVFIKLRAAVLAAKVAMDLMGLSVKTLVGATGIGLLLIVAAELYANWETIWPAMQKIIEGFAKNAGQIFRGLGNVIAGVLTLDPAQLEKGFDQLKESFATKADELKDTATQKEQERNAEVERLKAEHIARQEQMEKEANERKLAEEAAAAQAIQELKGLSFEQRLEKDREFQAILDEEDALVREQKLEMLAQRYAEDEELQRQANEKQLIEDLRAKKKLIEEEKKFGKAYMFLKSTLNNETVKEFTKASGELVQLTNSQNSTLKGIGKAAAVTQIGQRTAMSAMNVFEGFTRTVPPPFGIALGTAAAAAAVAYGGEQISRALAANQGGIVPGIGPNVDSVPAVLTPGELVVPRQNFDEVIDSVSRQRGQSEGGSQGGQMEVVIGFRDEAFEIIEQKLRERVVIGV